MRFRRRRAVLLFAVMALIAVPVAVAASTTARRCVSAIRGREARPPPSGHDSSFNAKDNPDSSNDRDLNGRDHDVRDRRPPPDSDLRGRNDTGRHRCLVRPWATVSGRRSGRPDEPTRARAAEHASRDERIQVHVHVGGEVSDHLQHPTAFVDAKMYGWGEVRKRSKESRRRETRQRCVSRLLLTEVIESLAEAQGVGPRHSYSHAVRATRGCVYCT